MPALLFELLVVLAVPTRGSEAAQCEPWRGHKSAACTRKTNPFKYEIFCNRDRTVIKKHTGKGEREKGI